MARRHTSRLVAVAHHVGFEVVEMPGTDHGHGHGYGHEHADRSAQVRPHVGGVACAGD
jgi:hypothetical protein